MRYTAPDKELFIRNRKAFCRELKPGSVAVFNANDMLPTNADGTLRFIQNSDLFYLSGIDQEESILVLFPDFVNEEMQEILFLKQTNEHIAVWEGHKYTKEEAREASGIKNIQWLSAFDSVFNALMAEAGYVYLNTNEHLRASVEVESRDARFIKQCQSRYPLHKYERSAPIMHKLRAVKSELEIAVLQHACNITARGFDRVMSFTRPGVWEYEIEAEYLHEFVRNRSRGFGYEPIVASGANACVLHYIDNQAQCKDGDLLLMDVGAEYGNYKSDMTRAIPVNGKFTDRQRAVYTAVLRVQREAFKLLRPGNTIREYHAEVGRLMEKELIELKLLDAGEVAAQDPKKPLYRKYFMHGTSHHLGLDVHDVGSVHRPFEPGMVFTVEPGIYIPDEQIGIRLENDVVITENGIHDLMSDIPIDPEDIESHMN